MIADTGVGIPAPGGPNLRTVSPWGCFIFMLLCFELLEGGDVHFFVHGSSEPVKTLSVKCALRARCATSPFATGQVCCRISASMCCPGRAQRVSGPALFGRAPSSGRSGEGHPAQPSNRLCKCFTHREAYAKGFCKAFPAWRRRRSFQQTPLASFVSWCPSDFTSGAVDV